MRRAALVVAAGLLLAAPTVLAFFSGGFFTEPRLIAAIAAWLIVLVLAAIGETPLPRNVPGWLAVGGLALLAAWTAASIGWAPLRGPATEDVERLLLYLGALLIAIAVARVPFVMDAFEPALAAGITIVIGEGLSGRLLPGLIHLAHSSHAGGRLEQPITYWNSEGALAAIGLVLSTSAKSPIAGLEISNGLRPGLAMWAKQLADELGPQGVRVFSLLPGRVLTDRTLSLTPDPADRERIAASIPLRRYGEPAEFGRVAAFLLSPAASYLSGLAVPVDGGALRTF